MSYLFEHSCRRLWAWMRAVVLLPVLLTVWLASPVLADTGTLRIGTGDWVPYVDESRADGGAVARLVSAVFAELGYEVEFVFYPWDRNILMLQNGQLDAIMPYTCSSSRLVYGACSEPLARGEIVLFHRKEQAFDWQQLDDLKRYRIGITHGYSYGPAFDQALQAGELLVEQSSKDDSGFRLLERGRIDLHPQDRAVGYAMLRRLFPSGEGEAITHHVRPLNTEPMRVLFRNDDERSLELLRRFNVGLRRFAERGDLLRLQEALYSGSADSWQPTAVPSQD